MKNKFFFAILITIFSACSSSPDKAKVETRETFDLSSIDGEIMGKQEDYRTEEYWLVIQKGGQLKKLIVPKWVYYSSDEIAYYRLKQKQHCDDSIQHIKDSITYSQDQ